MNELKQFFKALGRKPARVLKKLYSNYFRKAVLAVKCIGKKDAYQSILDLVGEEGLKVIAVDIKTRQEMAPVTQYKDAVEKAEKLEPLEHANLLCSLVMQSMPGRQSREDVASMLNIVLKAREYKVI